MAAIAPGLIAPPVSDGTLINGVAHFVTTSKPTVRIDGGALVSGDRWYNPVTGISGYWNGTYWLSTPKEWHMDTIASQVGPVFWRRQLGRFSNVFVYSSKHSFWVTVNNTVNDYWAVNILVDSNSTSAASGVELPGTIANTQSLNTNLWRFSSRTINTVVSASLPFIVTTTKVGATPGSLVSGHTIFYSDVLE